jgi:hypothetical protein
MNSLNGVSRASRSANFSATTAILLVTGPSTESALRRKEKARQSIAGGMGDLSMTRTPFSPGPKRESATSLGALPAMVRDGPQLHRPTLPEMHTLAHTPKKNPGATGIAAGAKQGIANVIYTEFIDSPQE